MSVLTHTQIEQLVSDVNLIGNYDSSSLEGASYDMRLGPHYIQGGKTKSLTDSDRSVTLEPGAFALLSTYELLEMPLDLIGHNGIMSPWAKRGLVSLFSPQIDPGFQGMLIVPVFNAGDGNITLTLRDPIFTVEFVRCDAPALFGWSDKYHRQTTMSALNPPPDKSKANLADIHELKSHVDSLKAEVIELTSHEYVLAKEVSRVERQSKFAMNITLWIHGIVITALLTGAAILLPMIFQSPSQGQETLSTDTGNPSATIIEEQGATTTQ